VVPLVVLLVLLLASSLVSRRLVNGPVTPPAIVTVAGLALVVVAGQELSLDTAGLRLATEVTLSLVLFVDASRVPLRSLEQRAALPGRLLGIGLPLSISTLTGLAMLVLDLPLGPALLVGAALSATDAALARVIVESEDLPTLVRQAVNVESGLNDGLATPVVTIAIALAAGTMQGTQDVVNEFVAPVGGAIVLGIAIGAAAGVAVRAARRRDLVDEVFAQLAIVAVVGLVVAAAIATGAITFVAAFLAGSAFRQVCGPTADEVTAYTEDSARLLTIAAFFAFGMTLLPDGLAVLTARDWVVVVAALTVGRMVPVMIALVGTGLRWPTTAFIGWFGPRGLATVLFTLLAVEEAEAGLPDRALAVLATTVLASLVLHGATAGWLTGRYVAWLDARRAESDHGASMPEVAMADDDGHQVEVTRTRS